MREEDFTYDSFLIEDGELDGQSDFFKKHDKPYAERYAEWQAVEDAKPLDQLLDECRGRAHQAVDDAMKGVRNAPLSTLETEMKRGYALEGMIRAIANNSSTMIYAIMLSEVPPVQGPAKTYHDYAMEAVEKMAEAVDRAIMGRILG